MFVGYGKTESQIIELIDSITKSDNKIKVVNVVSSKELVTDEINIENNLRRMLYERKIAFTLVWDLTMIHVDDIPFSLTRDTLTFFTKSAVIDKVIMWDNLFRYQTIFLYQHTILQKRRMERKSYF